MVNLVGRNVVTALPLDRRDYRIFTVIKKNGEVVSMKIRELAAT
jgi:hypothetical protein